MRRFIKNSPYALKFAGAGLVNTSGLPTSYPNGFTMSIEVKEDNIVAANSGIFIHLGSDYQKGFALQVDQNKQLALQYRDSTATNTSRSIAAGYKPGRFITYDAVVDAENDEIRIYRNGIKIDSVSFTGTITPTTSSLGYGGDLFYSGHRLNGIINSVRIWSRGLTRQEIIEKYNKGTIPTDSLELEHKLNTGSGTSAIDTSGNNRNGTISGATWTAETPSNPRS